jgi:hypothetical protein
MEEVKIKNTILQGAIVKAEYYDIIVAAYALYKINHVIISNYAYKRILSTENITGRKFLPPKTKFIINAVELIISENINKNTFYCIDTNNNKSYFGDFEKCIDDLIRI